MFKEDISHMPSNAKKCYNELLKMGVPVLVWSQTDPKYEDYRGYFWLGFEDQNEWANYYGEGAAGFIGVDEMNAVFDKYDLYWEWANPAYGCVYDA
jgi:hypothetical protein